jgi:hypothetical protein
MIDLNSVTNETPQFPIVGLVSKTFCIEMFPCIKCQDEEMFFVEAILSALVDSFGDEFSARITSGYRENNMKVCTTLDITFPTFQWLSDIGKRAAVFEKQVEELLKITKVSSLTNDGWSNTSTAQTARTYDLVVKDGTYEVKKTSKISYVVKTIEDGIFKGSQYPSYSIDDVNF